MEEKEIKLDMIWNVILSKYLNLCAQNSSSFGPGLNVFEFQDRSYKKNHNCEYHYIQKKSGLWTKLLELCPNYERDLENYKETLNMIIIVKIPYEIYDLKIIDYDFSQKDFQIILSQNS